MYPKNEHILTHFPTHFSTLFRERSWSDLGTSSTRFGSHFASILAPFWESSGDPFEKWKLSSRLKREPHFHCSRVSENHCFFDLLSERPPEPPLEPLLGVLGSILARFWGPLGTLFSTIFRTFFRARFLTPKMSQKYPKRGSIRI